MFSDKIKRLSRIAARIVEDDGKNFSYLDYGHGDSPKDGNILWVYYGGRVLKRPEEFLGDSGLTHDEIFWDVEESHTLPYGRYEPSTETITLVLPRNLRHRNLPDFLVNALERAFPDAEELRVY